MQALWRAHESPPLSLMRQGRESVQPEREDTNAAERELSGAVEQCTHHLLGELDATMKTLSAPLALVGLLCLLPVTASAWDFRQSQSQAQGQAQSQGQGQVNDQTIAPSQSVRHETTFDRYAPSIAAPALTSGGIGICLGSFSAGITVPMVGAMFGKTIVDKGCSAARDAMILYNMGHKGAALRVLSGESIKDAMAAEGILPASKSAAVMEPTPVAVQSSAIVEGGR